MDYVRYNRRYWDKEVRNNNIWTQPVSSEKIDDARKGNWDVLLTPTKVVPKTWFPKSLKEKRVLCLASAGGQQAPIFAALGAEVSLVDNSPLQLEQDKFVAKRDNLSIRTDLGDMRDLSIYPDDYFDLIFHPISNCFVENIIPIWQESYRVLKSKGVLLAGFTNPLQYIFDLKAWNNGELIVRHKIPYSDLESIDLDERKELIIEKGDGVYFGHTLQDQIQGQIDAGFLISGFYEDNGGGKFPLDKYIDFMIATKAIKY